LPASQDLIETDPFLVVGQRGGYVCADLSLPASGSLDPLGQLVGETHRHPLHTIIIPLGGVVPLSSPAQYPGRALHRPGIIAGVDARDSDATPGSVPEVSVVVEGGADRPSGAEAWSALASWYDSLLVARSGPHETAVACLLRLLPDLTGARVLDVACGQGLATRALVEAGATSVTGVDSAEAMIDLARQRTDPAAPVSYVVDDATRLASFADGAVDGVTCQLGLMDIADLDATVVAARRVLRPGGWFVAIIGHPCFLAPHAATTQLGGQPARAVRSYFHEGLWRSSNPQGIRGRAGNCWRHDFLVR